MTNQPTNVFKAPDPLNLEGATETAHDIYLEDNNGTYTDFEMDGNNNQVALIAGDQAIIITNEFNEDGAIEDFTYASIAWDPSLEAWDSLDIDGGPVRDVTETIDYWRDKYLRPQRPH